VKFWLLTLTRNQVLRLVMVKTILRRRKEEGGGEEGEVGGEEKEEQQQQASAEFAITNTGQRNHQPNCTVFFSRPKKGHSV